MSNNIDYAQLLEKPMLAGYISKLFRPEVTPDLLELCLNNTTPKLVEVTEALGADLATLFADADLRSFTPEVESTLARATELERQIWVLDCHLLARTKGGNKRPLAILRDEIGYTEEAAQ